MKVEVSHAPEPEDAREHTADTTSTTTANDSAPQADQNDKPETPEASQGPSTAAKARQARDGLRVKTKRARSRILILIACLAYIVTTFTTASMGLQDISSYLKPRLEDARVNLRAQGNLRYRERMLYTQLDKLQDMRLRRGGFMETYEECLARGLLEANQQFFGLGFQYPDIREETIEWTEENCGRLLYTPQISGPTTQQAILNHWARTTDTARRVFEKTMDIVTSTWVRCINVFGIRSPKVNEHPVTSEDLPRGRVSPATRPDMPFGFSLDCDASRCRLIYLKTADAPADKATISHDEIIKSVLKADGLARFCTKVNYLQRTMASLALFFVPLEILFLVAYSAAGIYAYSLTPSAPPKTDKALHPSVQTIRRLTNEEKYAAVSMLLQFVAMLAHSISDSRGSEVGKSALYTGMFMTALGLTMFINLFFPAGQPETGHHISKTIKELRTILTSAVEEPVSAPVPAETSPKFNNHLTFKELQDLMSRSSRKASPARRESVSLATTVQEDVRSEVEAMREEQKHHAYVESDSDSDFDGEPFVDLAGGITPTTEEVEPDVVVVDA